MLNERRLFGLLKEMLHGSRLFGLLKEMLNGSRLFGLLKEMLNGSGLFALLSRGFEQMFGQIVSIRMKTIGNTNMVASRLIKREKGSLPVDVCRSKTALLKVAP